MDWFWYMATKNNSTWTDNSTNHFPVLVLNCIRFIFGFWPVLGPDFTALPDTTVWKSKSSICSCLLWTYNTQLALMDMSPSFSILPPLSHKSNFFSTLGHQHPRKVFIKYAHPTCPHLFYAVDWQAASRMTTLLQGPRASQRGRTVYRPLRMMEMHEHMVRTTR